MSDFERINAPRVDKIVDMLRVIAKSAKSNKASDEEVAALLAPVRKHLGIGGDEIPRTRVRVRPNTPKTNNGLKNPSWVDARNFAETLSLNDLGHVMAVAMNRVDEALEEAREGG